MKNNFLKVLLVVTALFVSTHALFAQEPDPQRDYFLFSWGQSHADVHRWLRLTGTTIIRVSPYAIEVSERTPHGIPRWVTYYFGNDSLEFIKAEIATEFHSQDRIPMIYEHHLPMEMSLLIALSRSPFELVSRGDSFRVWRSERSFSAAFYVPDNCGYYRIIAYLGRKTNANMRMIEIDAASFGYTLPLVRSITGQ